MKKILMIICLILLLNPVYAQFNLTEIDLKNLDSQKELELRQEIDKQINSLEIDTSQLSKISFALPITLEIQIEDLDKSFFLQLSEEGLQTIISPPKQDIVLKGNAETLEKMFQADTEFSQMITNFEFEVKSFKGSIIAVGLEKISGQELIKNPTFGQKVIRSVAGIFV